MFQATDQVFAGPICRRRFSCRERMPSGCSVTAPPTRWTSFRRTRLLATARGLLRPGDLIYLSAGTASQRSQTGADHGAARMALLMVLAGARGAVAVRLAQDFGRTEDADPAKLPDAALPVAAAPPAMPARRGRGRPPGSRNRKNGALAATALN
jgi:hypothetical protein